MNTASQSRSLPIRVSAWVRGLRPLRAVAGVVLGLGYAATSPAADINLADAPLFSTSSVPGNLALALSVEFPTAVSVAYQNTSAYTTATAYVGYADPEKCYAYKYNSTTPSSSFFVPYGAATSRTCKSTESNALWSGNYLNWLSMQTMDIFRWAMTGGYRSVDTVGTTILTKIYNDTQGGGNNAPDKTLSGSGVSGATPFNWDSLTTSIKARGTQVWFSGTDVAAGGSTYGCTGSQTCLKFANNGTPTAYNKQSSYAESPDKANASSTYSFYLNIKVCDATVGLESNCVAYGTDNKPEGLMQKYASKLRYAAFSYLNDGDNSPQKRDGGVLRAPMKFIGPTQPVPGSDPITNSAAEWSATTGIMLANPDPTYASQTTTSTGVTISQSGAMNYMNKFGLSGGTGNNLYQTYDSVSELYYAALRYFRNLGTVSTYGAMASPKYPTPTVAQKTQWLDGFPVVNTWTDPILYSCQKNFILGVGDVNTHYDENVPGSTLTSTWEPTMPSEVSADTTWGNGTTWGSAIATRMVAQLEGISPTSKLGDTKLGDYATYYIAGMAYQAHTSDMRSDLAGVQTINTYWVDVMEFQQYASKNQYYLAAKYGGFTVPAGFSPYATGNNKDTLTEAAWHSNGKTDKVGSDLRPDNYFGGNQGATMYAGLSAAFAKIVLESTGAFGTSYATANRVLNNTGSASYSANYDPTNWSGQVIGSSVSYDTSGNPTQTAIWDARSLLENPKPSERKIITCCTSTGAGLPFTTTALGGSLDPRTYYASFDKVPGVTGTQSKADFVDYLRGDHGKEARNSGGYRNRTYRLGDIVNSKPTAVPPPTFPYYDLFNDGYSTFKTTYAGRPTVVYVGANDGMLHAFDGSLTSTTKGTELFAYIPSFAYGTASNFATLGLAALGNPSFSHHYLVDGTALNFDVDLNKTYNSGSTSADWHTLLIGGLGKGGKGYYALDVTNPSGWTNETVLAGKVLWEFTDNRMGYTFGEPHVVKTKKYGWVVILPSGYNNADGKGYIFIVNPKTGALLEAVATSSGSDESPINIGEIRTFIPDYTDYTADSVYAGDLRGNVWRWDLTGTSGTYSAATQIATLTNAAGNALPVTTKPLIGVDPTTKKRYLLVGTGRQLADTDVNTSTLQAMYAIVDGTGLPGGFYTSSTLPSGYTFPIGRANLVANTDLLAGIGANPSSPMGWYHDLTSTRSIAERIETEGDLNQGVAVFAANLPSGDVCTPRGTSRNFAVTYANGKSLLLDNSGNVIASRTNSDGVATDAAIVNINGSLRYISGDSTGVVKNQPANLNGASGLTRLNWREISTVD